MRADFPDLDTVLPGEKTWNIRRAVAETSLRVLQGLRTTCELSSSHAGSVLFPIAADAGDNSSSGGTLSGLSFAQRRKIKQDIERMGSALRGLWEQTIVRVEHELQELLLFFPLDEDRGLVASSLATGSNTSWLQKLFHYAKNHPEMEAIALAAQQNMVDLGIRMKALETHQGILAAQAERHRATTGLVCTKLLKQIATLTQCLEAAVPLEGMPPTGGSCQPSPQSVSPQRSPRRSGADKSNNSTVLPVETVASPPARVAANTTSFNAVCLIDFCEFLEHYATKDVVADDDRSVSHRDFSSKHFLAGGGPSAATYHHHRLGISSSPHTTGTASISQRSRPNSSSGVDNAAVIGADRLNAMLERFTASVMSANETDLSNLSSPNAKSASATQLLAQIDSLEHSVSESASRLQATKEIAEIERRGLRAKVAQLEHDLRQCETELAHRERAMEEKESEINALKHESLVNDAKLDSQRAQLMSQIAAREHAAKEAELHLREQRFKINKLLERLANGGGSIGGDDDAAGSDDDMESSVVHDYLRSAKEIKSVQEELASCQELNEDLKREGAAREQTLDRCKDLLRQSCRRLFNMGVMPDSKTREMLQDDEAGLAEEGAKIALAALELERDAANCAGMKAAMRRTVEWLKMSMKTAFQFHADCETTDELAQALNIYFNDSTKTKTKGRGGGKSKVSGTEEQHSESEDDASPYDEFGSFEDVWNDQANSKRKKSSARASISVATSLSSDAGGRDDGVRDNLNGPLLTPCEDYEVSELLNDAPRIEKVVDRLLQRQQLHWAACLGLIRRLKTEKTELRMSLVLARARVPAQHIASLDKSMSVELADELRDFAENDATFLPPPVVAADKAVNTLAVAKDDEAIQTVASPTRDVEVFCQLANPTADSESQTDPVLLTVSTNVVSDVSEKHVVEPQQPQAPVIQTSEVVEQYMELLRSTSMRFAPGVTPVEARRQSLHSGGSVFAPSASTARLSVSFSGVVEPMASVSFPSGMPELRFMCHSCGIVNRRAPDGSEPRPLVTKSIGVQVELAAAVTVIEAPFSSVSVTASSSRAVAPEKDQTRGALKADNAARQSSSQSVTASAADQTTQLVVESTNISNNGNDHSVSTAIRDADPGLPCTLSAPQPAVNGYGTSMTSMDAGVQTSVKSESLYFRVPEVNLFSDQHLFDLGNAQLDGSKSFQPVDDLTAAQHSVRHFSENPRSARSSARVSSAASRRGASASSTARPDEAPAGSVGIDFGFRPIGDDDDVTWMVSETAGGDTSSAPHSRVMSAMARRLSAAGGRGGIGGAGEAVVSLPQRHPAVSGSAGVTAASSMLGGALVALPGADSSNPPPGSIAGNHFSARAALVVPPGSNIRFHRASSGGSKRAGAPSTSPAPQEAPKCSRALVEASRYATSSGANDEKHPQQLSAPPASYRHRFPAHSPVTASSGNAIIIDATSSGATIAGGHSTSAPQASQEQVIPVAYIHGAFVETFGCTPSALLHSNRSIKDLAAKASRVHSAAPSRSGKGTHVAPQGSSHREQQQQQQLLPPRASSATLVRDPVHR